MTEVKDVFKLTEEDKKKEKARRMNELRRFQLQLSGIPMRRLLEFGIEWQEATGKLLKRFNRPGWEEKSADVYRRKKELKEFYNSGTLKR